MKTPRTLAEQIADTVKALAYARETRNFNLAANLEGQLKMKRAALAAQTAA